MGWTPGPRAAWVEEANRGERPDFRPSPEPFDADTLIAEALARHAGAGQVDERILTPLALICAGLENDAQLTPLGRWATQRFLRRLVDGHLALDGFARSDPGVGDEAITAPIFVVGAPRTGTTALHRLLAADSRHRVPEGWELLLPLPPPTPEGRDDDPRIAEAGEELGFPQSVSGELRSIHTYSARMPKECLSAMSFAFRSEEFVSRYHLPGYVEWLHGCDMGPAYEAHHTVLRVLQRRMPARRWVLKSPVHLQSLPQLLTTYPDARLVVTHREPAEVVASVSSLIATLRSAFSDAVDPVAIGRYHLRLYSSSLSRLVDHVDSGLLPAERTVHVHHREIVGDAQAAIARVYRALGLDLTAEVGDAIEGVVAAEREDGVGAHRYELSDFGCGPDDLAEPFAAYRRRFLEGQ